MEQKRDLSFRYRMNSIAGKRVDPSLERDRAGFAVRYAPPLGIEGELFDFDAFFSIQTQQLVVSYDWMVAEVFVPLIHADSIARETINGQRSNW